MKCPECGSDSFMPESGCFTCGYLPPELRPTAVEDGGEPDMPIETLNRMLTQLGVAPLPDPEARLRPDRPVLPEDGAATEPNVPEDAVAGLPDAGESSPGLAAAGMAVPGRRNRLKDVRHVLGPLHAVPAAIGRFAGWMGGIFRTLSDGWRKLRQHAVARFSRQKPGGHARTEAERTGLSPEPFGTAPEQNVRVLSVPLVDPPAEPEAKPVRRNLPQALFWVGVPILALLATLGLLAGVLQLRNLRLAPAASTESSQEAGTRGFAYTPWMPDEEPAPEPFVVIGE